MKVSKTMKNNKTISQKSNFGFAPIKAQNPLPKSEPKSTVTSSGKDMRSKAGK